MVEVGNTKGETLEELCAALHDYNDSFDADQLARSLVYEIQKDLHFADRELSREWGPMWPRVQAFARRRASEVPK